VVLAFEGPEAQLFLNMSSAISEYATLVAPVIKSSLIQSLLAPLMTPITSKHPQHTCPLFSHTELTSTAEMGLVP
jgi:hypothetical protein